jgi:hypothetical protein
MRAGARPLTAVDDEVFVPDWPLDAMAKGRRLGELGRRDVLRAGLIGLGGGITGFGAGPVNEVAAAAPTSVGSRILVVVELSGANDALNTIVPYPTTPTIGRAPSSA